METTLSVCFHLGKVVELAVTKPLLTEESMSTFICLRETMFKVYFALILLSFSTMSTAQILAPALLSAAGLITTTLELAVVGEDCGAIAPISELEQVEYRSCTSTRSWPPRLRQYYRELGSSDSPTV